MKKWLLVFFVFAFAVLGFGAKSASALVIGFGGCTSAGPYNTQTGQLCVNPTNVVGCLPGYPFSPVTGQSCNTNTFNLPYGCTSSQGFSITTGQPCYGSTYFPPPTFPPGCTSNFGFSTYDGQSCGGYYPQPPIYPPYNSQQPIISQVNGPQSLSVNQQGTWSVIASNPNGGNLSYSVYWGDEPFGLYANQYPTATQYQQFASFTHIYTRAGNYTPTFTVTSQNTINCFTTPCPTNGGSAQTSLSVNVFGTTAQFQIPTISFLSPSSAAIGRQVTIFGSGLSGATVNFGGYPVQAVTMSDSQLTFVVPSNLSNCILGLMCTQVYNQVNRGSSYPVSVSNTSGTSNQINFTVAYF